MTSAVTVVDLMKLVEGDPRPQIVDVRSAAEFASGHVPGAVNIPLEELEWRVDDLRAASPVILVCQSGARASMAAERLAEYRTNLLVLEGGTSAWQRNGLCTVATARSRWSLERQVRLGAGVLVLTGIALGAANPAGLCLSAFVGAGLIFAGLTNICGMAALLAKMPWNRPRRRAA